jgi:hypothetical protein
MTDQGSAFPYTKGLWLLSNLIAALNPDDLDALDENVPFSKFTLDELLGRYHTPEEYHYYFRHNPHSSLYQQYFEELLTVPQVARKIIPPEMIPKPSLSRGGGGGGGVFVFILLLFIFFCVCIVGKKYQESL